MSQRPAEPEAVTVAVPADLATAAAALVAAHRRAVLQKYTGRVYVVLNMNQGGVTAVKTGAGTEEVFRQ